MKKILVGILMVMVMVGVGGCATIEATMKKPKLFIDFEYPIKDVYYESFKIWSSQDFVFELGSFDEKFFALRLWDDAGIPIKGIYSAFEKLNENKTRVEFQYNHHEDLDIEKLKNRINHLMQTININLMIKYNETKLRPYKIHDFEKWLDYYEAKPKF